MDNVALSAYAARDDLRAYGSNGLLLFALQLQFDLDDIESIAADSLTDGNNDKKCDLVYVSRERGRLVIAQGYEAKEPGTRTGRADKASDLNTAASWLLAGETNGLPDSLKSAAEQVRSALEAAAIDQVDLWYVHNQRESSNVKRELQQAANTAKGVIETWFPNSEVTSVSGREIGLETLADLYRRTQTHIAVTDVFRVPIQGGFPIESDSWQAYCTSVSGTWLTDLWRQYQTDLLSSNVRDYLGVVKTRRNINNGIKLTAREEPQQFWIYNNGLTVLVNDYNVAPSGDEIEISGIGIVNGAQTTGALGTLTAEESANVDKIKVMVRFVKSNDRGILNEVVRYNNSQNRVEAADFRSKDEFQERLRQEFATIPEATYRGGRRGGTSDAIERQKNLLADSAVAQSLAAFHANPNLAYNDTRRIWEDDGTYSGFFNEKTTARHVVLTYSLLRAVESAKKEIADLDEDKRTKSQHGQMAFFRQRGSIQLLIAAIAESLESILGRAVTDRFSLSFGKRCSPKSAVLYWAPIVQATLPFAYKLADAADRNLQNAEKVRKALAEFQSFIESTAAANEGLYSEFRSKVTMD